MASDGDMLFNLLLALARRTLATLVGSFALWNYSIEKKRHLETSARIAVRAPMAGQTISQT